MQTVAFAFALRGEDTGKILDASVQPLATDEAAVIVKELWEKAASHAPADTTASQAMMLFIRSVFEWVEKHMNR